MKILSIAGMRSFGNGDNDDGYDWVLEQIHHLLLGARDTVIVTAGTEGPELWAARFARKLGLRRRIYRKDGRLSDTLRGEGRWLEENLKPSSRQRDAALVRDLQAQAARGAHVRLVAFLDATHEPAKSGTAYRAGLAREAGLTVVEATWGQAPATTEEAAPVAAE